jgi:hypothetical protein
MDADDLREWADTKAFKSYKDYRDRQRYNGYTMDVLNRAIRVANGTATRSDRQKVASYLSRAKAAYRSDGAGSTTHAGTARNVVALRNWGYDPYGTYS